MCGDGEFLMNALLISMALLVGQTMSMQERPVIHLKPNSDLIESGFSGALLELQNAPGYLHLPKFPPKPDGQGKQWFVDVKNFGPHPVVIDDRQHFNLRVGVSETVHIYSNGTMYYLKR